ncbi:hypothetical protein FN846DRAFT_903706 [Sphaerosporella brunnea]|uniref:Uncharacterized protein n=1 Tax=Sphaerosporella brunnea TaxID=1250544 RepID=A0A5J5F6C6_9PEZI|nr:hypothetical protein FN846DRAFT_903706 [Sphaerosporella brunnea]
MSSAVRANPTTSHPTQSRQQHAGVGNRTPQVEWSPHSPAAAAGQRERVRATQLFAGPYSYMLVVYGAEGILLSPAVKDARDVSKERP